MKRHLIREHTAVKFLYIAVLCSLLSVITWGISAYLVAGDRHQSRFTVDTDGPLLTVEPKAGQTAAEPVYTNQLQYGLWGTARDQGSGLKEVTVHGSAVTVDEEDHWEHLVPLEENTLNTILVQAVDRTEKTVREYRYVYCDTNPPILTVKTPAGTAAEAPLHTAEDSVTIQGLATDETPGVVSVKAAGQDLEVAPDGTWQITIPLEVGCHQILVEAQDPVGNQTSCYVYICRDGSLEVVAEGYSGVYDGQPHSISVYCPEAEITYSQTVDGEYGTTNPTFVDAGTYQVYYKVQKSGYTMTTGVETVVIQKADGRLELSERQVTLGYPATSAVAVISNSSGGDLQAASSAAEVAEVHVEGDQIIISTKAAGMTVVTVTSAATRNYHMVTETFVVIADQYGPELHVIRPTGLSAEDPMIAHAGTCLVEGTATDDYGLRSVTVDGVAIEVDTDGHWQREILLEADGVVREICVVAEDMTGKTTTEKRYVVVPVDVSIYKTNRTWAGYTGADGEMLELLSAFRDGDGKWCRAIAIDNEAFADCTGLRGVVIPDTVASIGQSAFSRCSGLAAVVIPESVTSIGNQAFRECTSLAEVTIPDTVTSMGTWVFAKCSGLTQIHLPQGIKEIPSYTLYGCSSLTEIHIPASVTTLGAYALSACHGLTEVELPQGMVTIGNQVFDQCANLTKVTIPDSVTSIGNGAFRLCTSLEEVMIPDSVTALGASAFEGCSVLTRVTLSNQIRALKDNTFKQCVSLTEITLPEALRTIGKRTFEGCVSLTGMTLPTLVESVGDYAFYQCGGLEKVIMGDQIASLGAYSFAECEAMTEVILSGGLKILGDHAFAECENIKALELPVGLEEIHQSAFYNCRRLQEMTVPDSVVSIGNWAFGYCTNMARLTVGQGVTELAENMMYRCYQMHTIVIKGKLTAIRDSAFDRCSGLLDIYFAGTQEEWSQIQIGINNERMDNATIHYHYVES